MNVMATLAMRSTVAADTPLSIVATLERPDGSSGEIDRPTLGARDAARATGATYSVALPTATLPPGACRLRVDVAHGDETAARSLQFTRLR